MSNVGRKKPDKRYWFEKAKRKRKFLYQVQGHFVPLQTGETIRNVTPLKIPQRANLHGCERTVNRKHTF